MNLFDAKRQFKNVFLMRFDSGDAVTFHMLKWGVYKLYRDTLLINEDMHYDAMIDIFLGCVIDSTFQYKQINDQTERLDLSEVINDVPAGIINTVSSMIYGFSGTDNPESFFNDLNEYRKNALIDGENRIITMVTTLLKYKKEEIEDLYWEDVVKIIIQSELMIAGNVPAVPFAPDGPGAVKKIDFDKDNKMLRDN